MISWNSFVWECDVRSRPRHLKIGGKKLHQNTKRTCMNSESPMILNQKSFINISAPNATKRKASLLAVSLMGQNNLTPRTMWYQHLQNNNIVPARDHRRSWGTSFQAPCLHFHFVFHLSQASKRYLSDHDANLVEWSKTWILCLSCFKTNV